MLGTVNASTVTWSPTGQNSGGSGTWNTVDSIWYNGTILMPWNNAAGDSALFGGSGGTVTLAGGLRVQDLNFTSDGYSLLGGGIFASRHHPLLLTLPVVPLQLFIRR